MGATDFIVAIELGSSKITGIAGKKNSDGSLQILACATEDSSSFIRKGVIYNLNKTAQSLTSIINQLEGKLDSSIAKVYVGIGGQSLRTINNTVVRHLDEENTISQEIVDAINDENINIPLIDLEILDVAPQEYKIGNNFQIEPVGVISNHIEGRFLNIIAREAIKKNLEKCFAQANINVAEYFISPLVTAEVVLTDSEKRSGCALIDFGADTTTVSVYKNNILRHLAVIPLGGKSITQDICNLQIEENEAENLKIKYGNVISSQKEENEVISYPIDEKRNIEDKILNDIIEARIEEIIANVWNQIRSTGYDDKLIAGIIITGGGANLSGLEEAIRKRTKIEKVRIAKTIWQGVKGTEANKIQANASFNTILGLLYKGEENCCKPETVKPTPVVDLFGDEVKTSEIPNSSNSDLDKKKEEDRKKKEEEKKRKEEEKKKREEEKKNRPNKFKSMFEKFTTDIFSDDEMK